MTRPPSLFLYEEIMLLALHDEKGTIEAGFVEYVVGGAILSELLLARRITIEDTRYQMVNPVNPKPLGDPVIDTVLERIAIAKRRASLQNWILRTGNTPKLRRRVALRLCDRGIVRAEEDKILFLFTRRIYPEIDPIPETNLVERLRTAIFEDGTPVDPRTVILISLAHGTGLLQKHFGAKALRSRKSRIEEIVRGDVTGKATREVVESCQAAVIAASIVPAIAASAASMS